MTRKSRLVDLAGLPLTESERARSDSMQGRAPVMVATNASGLGNDKPDVRFVLHFDRRSRSMRTSRKSGAGRDGEPAEAVLFFHSKDLGVRRYFTHRIEE